MFYACLWQMMEYVTSRLMQNVGIQFIIHSGNHKLIYKDGRTEVVENGLWLGTIVYMETSTSKDVDPNELVCHRILKVLT